MQSGQGSCRAKMSLSKESISLPAIGKRPSAVQQGQRKTNPSHKPVVLSMQDLVTRQALKRVSLWFRTWRPWQQRVFVCRVMEHCSRRQLHFLATALEPVLHIDFSTSLVPHFASLHVDVAATFQVQRGIMQRVFSAELLEAEGSMPHLQSLPTTLLTRSSEVASMEEGGKGKRGGNGKVESSGLAVPLQKRGERGDAPMPILPLTHTQHVSLSLQPSIDDVLALRHTRFSSVPDLKSTTDLLRQVKHKEPFRPRHHRRSQTLGTYIYKKAKGGLSQSQKETEQFKAQLQALSQWMLEWPAIQQSQLLLEVVKLCNKDLLAYLVQCLYQRLHDQISMDSLPDSILLRIFSFLDVKALCRCAQVCQRWHHISLTPSLWQYHCQRLGVVEGVGDLVSAVKMGCLEAEGRKVDWKWVYRDLSRVIWRIKKLLLKAATEEEEKEREMGQKRPASKTTRAALRAALSLREMIELMCSRSHTPLSTVQEILQSAPESAATVRRRARKERKEAEEANMREEWERALSSRYRYRRPYDRSIPGSRLEGVIVEEDQPLASAHQHYPRTPETIELIQVAVDHRPGIPYLPDPDGVRCLVLAGCLIADQPHKPGKLQPIPRLRRLKPFESVVLCLQCDQRKVVCGTESREIHIYDIRSGRHVSTLTGHKGSVQCLQFDDYKIVSGSWDTTCIVWDIVHCSVVRELAGHTGCISCLQFDEQKLVTGSHDKSIRIWNTFTWECIAVIGHAHKEPLTCLMFNSSVVASGAADRCIKLWSLSTKKPLATLPHPDALTCLLLANSLLVSACRNGTIQLWSMEPYHHCPSSPFHGSLSRSPSHQTTPPPVPITQWELEEVFLTGMVLEGDRIFGSGSDNLIYEWDIATGTFTRTLTGHSRPVTCIGVTQSKLVSASEDHTLCVWYYKSWKALKEYEEVLMEESDPTFPDIPIRVVTD